jgi:hypothetical protein
MKRALKTLLAAVMALTATGVIGASGAQAAAEFHCHNSAGVGLPSCKFKAEKDGTGKVAHHVFVAGRSGAARSVVGPDRRFERSYLKISSVI